MAFVEMHERNFDWLLAMDESLFTEKALGRLHKINILGSSDWAFIPTPLPSRWRISSGLWPLLAEAREELARLDGVGRHMPNYELLLKPLQQREALKSSSLEGTYATPEQLLLFEIDPKEPKSQHDRTNAWKEVFNYNKALRLGQKLINEMPVSLRLIRELHKELLTGVRGYQRDPGNFRRTQVHIGSDRRFIPPPPSEALNCLYELEKYIHQDTDIDPLIYCFMVHYQFETIHPFLDGNGRVGRLLLSLMIYKWCKLISPWLYLSAFFDRYKDEYIDGLFNVSSKGDWDKWIAFCLRATLDQARDAIFRFDKLVALRDDYLNRVSSCGGNIRLNKVIDKLFESPAITVPIVSSMLSITYPTAKADVDILIRCDILSPSSLEGRPKVFLSPGIINIAYSDAST
jgi:Fic family protein